MRVGLSRKGEGGERELEAWSEGDDDRLMGGRAGDELLFRRVAGGNPGQSLRGGGFQVQVQSPLWPLGIKWSGVLGQH